MLKFLLWTKIVIFSIMQCIMDAFRHFSCEAFSSWPVLHQRRMMRMVMPVPQASAKLMKVLRPAWMPMSAI